VAKQIPDYLKLADFAPENETAGELSSIELLCSAFEGATGWRLQYDRGDSARAEASAGLVLTPARRSDDEPAPRLPRQQVELLAAAIAAVLGELDATRTALAEREAELAAGVPVISDTDDAAHLVERLESSLQAAVKTVGATAAALYLLDEATSQLKLRSCVGLPRTRLLDAPRPLKGALADLEALLGHAVVIEDTTLLPHWRCPENFPAAACVPVSTANTPLGTLWLFSDEKRDFTPSQTNVIEVVAGRIATELEREMLLTAGAQSKALERELDEAAHWQQERLPTIAPIIDDWDVAGVSQSGHALASEFFDWSVLPDGQFALALGDAHGSSITSGLSAAAIQATLKAHGNYRHDARQMLERVNDTLWTSSPGGHYASLFYGLLAPHQNALEFSHAGRLGSVLVHPDGHIVLARGTGPLGSDLDLALPKQTREIAAGAALLVVSDGVLATANERGVAWNENALAEFIRRHLHLTADELLARLHSALGPVRDFERTLLLLKRLR
jgi:GAF domain-containing protein